MSLYLAIVYLYIHPAISRYITLYPAVFHYICIQWSARVAERTPSIDGWDIPCRLTREEEGRAQAECEALAARSEQIERELEVASWLSAVLASLSTPRIDVSYIYKHLLAHIGDTDARVQ